MDSENKDLLFGLIFGFLLGIAIGFFILAIVDPIIISQETADDICQQLTENEEAVGDSRDSVRLICEIPSFDETQNIIIRRNDE